MMDRNHICTQENDSWKLLKKLKALNTKSSMIDYVLPALIMKIN